MLNNTTVTFAGNLAADPDLRFTTGGKAVLELRVMVNRRTRGETPGEYVDAEPTAWTCKVWGDLAQNVADSVGKGDRVLVHGRIETEAWTDRDSGARRTRDVVNVEEIGVSLTWATATPTKPTR